MKWPYIINSYIAMNKPSLPALTGFRFIAASFVFLYHYNPFPKNTLPGSICNEMYTGVGLFFVLSGFLICYNYYDEVRLDKGFLKKFLVKRFARIYPVYFILTTVLYIYFFLRTQQNYTVPYVLNITLIKGFSTDYLFSGLIQTWSLTVEECFYVLAPFIFLLIRRKIFFLQIFFITGAGILLVLLFRTFPFHGFFKGYNLLFMATFFGRCLEFFIGIKLALIYKKYKPGHIALNGQSLKKMPYYTIIGIVSVFICLLGLSFITKTFNVPHAVNNVWGLAVNNAIFPVATAFLIYGLIKERSLLYKFLSSSPIELIGKSSYVFYLIHAGLYADVIAKYTGHNIIILYLCLQALSIIIFLSIEKPLNTKIKTLVNIKSGTYNPSLVEPALQTASL